MNIDNIFIKTSTASSTIKNNKSGISKTETNEITVSKAPDTGFMNAADRIYNRISGLRSNYQSLDRMNARNVVSLASNAICKGNSIHTNISNIAYKFQEQISRILCSSLSQDEIEQKIKAIESKMNAVAKEANAKMDILTSLSDSLFKLGNIATDMKNNDLDSYNGVEFIKKLIEKLDTKTDDFSKINTDDKNEVNEKILKDLDNIYGKESKKKLEKQKEEFEKIINEIKDKLKNPVLPDEEICKLNTLLELYNHRINAIVNILNIFDEYSKPNNTDKE